MRRRKRRDDRCDAVASAAQQTAPVGALLEMLRRGLALPQGRADVGEQVALRVGTTVQRVQGQLGWIGVAGQVDDKHRVAKRRRTKLRLVDVHHRLVLAVRASSNQPNETWTTLGRRPAEKSRATEWLWTTSDSGKVSPTPSTNQPTVGHAQVQDASARQPAVARPVQSKPPRW